MNGTSNSANKSRQAEISSSCAESANIIMRVPQLLF